MEIDLFKDNIQSFISDFNIENYEMNNDKNDVINISNYNKYLSNEEEEWICDECFVSSNILYNNIDQQKKCLSTYEDEWSGSITILSKTKYNTEVRKLNFPLNLLQVNISFEIFH